MQVFINEKSLQGQYTAGNVEQGIRTFLSVLSFLDKLKDKGTVFKSTLLFNEQAIKDVHLNAILPWNGDLLNAFTLNIKSAAKWESERVHSDDDHFAWKADNVSGSSVAELAERKIQNNLLAGVLLNFSDSTYSSELQIGIKKNANVDVELDCSFNEATLIVWLRKHGLISQHDAYDVNSKTPPLDDQTILADARFEKTVYKNKGRRAYRLIGTNQLWAVDASEGHIIGAPHLEVFDEISGKHLGTSLYNVIALDKKYKRNRSIRLDLTYPID